MIALDLVELVLHSCMMRTIYHCLDVLSSGFQGLSSLTQNKAMRVKKLAVVRCWGALQSWSLVGCEQPL